MANKPTPDAPTAENAPHPIVRVTCAECGAKHDIRVPDGARGVVWECHDCQTKQSYGDPAPEPQYVTVAVMPGEEVVVQVASGDTGGGADAATTPVTKP
jgi:ribosomal protein L37AE/L43A